MLNRKEFIRYAVMGGAALAVTACVGANTSNVTPVTVVTLTQVKNVVAAIVPELPALQVELANMGTLNPAQLADANKAIVALQGYNPVLQGLSTDSSAKVVVNNILTSLSVILSYIPAANKYAPLVLILQATLNAYLNNTSL